MLYIDLLPKTQERIDELCQKMGLFQADVVASAVDLLYQNKTGTPAAEGLECQEKSAAKKPRARPRKEK